MLPFQANACDVMYLTGGTNTTLSLGKQCSRLATVTVSLGMPDATTNAMTKEMDYFYLAQTAVSEDAPIQSYIQLNNQRWPQFDITGTKQHFMRMLQGLGVLKSASHSVNIVAQGYGDGTAISIQFVALYDLEAVPHAEGTGVPVQGGGTVQITLKSMGGPTRAYVTTHFDAVLEIRRQGAIAHS